MEYTNDKGVAFNSSSRSSSSSDLNSIALQSFSKYEVEDDLNASEKSSVYKRKTSFNEEKDDIEETRTDSAHSSDDELTAQS